MANECNYTVILYIDSLYNSWSGFTWDSPPFVLTVRVNTESLKSTSARVTFSHSFVATLEMVRVSVITMKGNNNNNNKQKKINVVYSAN